MYEFMKFVDELKNRFPIHVEIGYNKTCDWCIYIYKQGCASEYKNSEHSGNDAVLCNVQDCEMELCFAKAQVELKEWLCENNGGY